MATTNKPTEATETAEQVQTDKFQGRCRKGRK